MNRQAPRSSTDVSPVPNRALMRRVLNAAIAHHVAGHPAGIGPSACPRNGGDLLRCRVPGGQVGRQCRQRGK